MGSRLVSSMREHHHAELAVILVTPVSVCVVKMITLLVIFPTKMYLEEKVDIFLLFAFSSPLRGSIRNRAF